MKSIECPNCHQFKSYSPKQQLFWAGLCGVVLGVPLIIFIVGIFLIPAGIILMIVSAFIDPHKRTCRNCKFSWNV